jgi:hypothetical protein
LIQRNDRPESLEPAGDTRKGDGGGDLGLFDHVLQAPGGIRGVQRNIGSPGVEDPQYRHQGIQ